MRYRYGWLLALLALALPLAAWGAAAKAAARTTVGRVDITGENFTGSVQGPYTWSKGVTVTSQGMTLTCDTLKVWPAKGSREFSRMEAMGNVVINGLYTASDKTKWQVHSTAERGGLDNTTGLGTLNGNVNVHAVNVVDKSALGVQADTFTYNRKTQGFTFERGGKPVQAQFEPAPMPATKPAPKAVPVAKPAAAAPAAKPVAVEGGAAK